MKNCTVVEYNGKKYIVKDKNICFLLASATSYPDLMEEIKVNIDKKPSLVKCEQCGNIIKESDYDLYGCVCPQCAIENLHD